MTDLNKLYENLESLLNYCLETKHDFKKTNRTIQAELKTEELKEYLYCGLNERNQFKKLGKFSNINLDTLKILDIRPDNILYGQNVSFESALFKQLLLNRDFHQDKNIDDNLLQIFVYKPNKYDEFYKLPPGIKLINNETIEPHIISKNLYTNNELSKFIDEEFISKDRYFMKDAGGIKDMKSIISKDRKLYKREIDPFVRDWDSANSSKKNDNLEKIEKINTHDIYVDKSTKVFKSITKKYITYLPVNDHLKTSINKIHPNFINEQRSILLFNNVYKSPSHIIEYQNNGKYFSLIVPKYNGNLISIDEGFSVRKISTIIKKFMDNNNYISFFKDLKNSIDNDQDYEEIDEDEKDEENTSIKKNPDNLLKLIKIVYFLVEQFKNDNYSYDESSRILMIILLDLKKSGDWGLVQFCKTTNSVLFTKDALCAIYAMIKEISLCFSIRYDGWELCIFYTGKDSQIPITLENIISMKQKAYPDELSNKILEKIRYMILKNYNNSDDIKTYIKTKLFFDRYEIMDSILDTHLEALYSIVKVIHKSKNSLMYKSIVDSDISDLSEYDASIKKNTKKLTLNLELLIDRIIHTNKLSHDYEKKMYMTRKPYSEENIQILYIKNLFESLFDVTLSSNIEDNKSIINRYKQALVKTQYLLDMNLSEIIISDENVYYDLLNPYKNRYMKKYTNYDESICYQCGNQKRDTYYISTSENKTLTKEFRNKIRKLERGEERSRKLTRAKHYSICINCWGKITKNESELYDIITNEHFIERFFKNVDENVMNFINKILCSISENFKKSKDTCRSYPVTDIITNINDQYNNSLFSFIHGIDEKLEHISEFLDEQTFLIEYKPKIEWKNPTDYSKINKFRIDYSLFINNRVTKFLKKNYNLKPYLITINNLLKILRNNLTKKFNNHDKIEKYVDNMLYYIDEVRQESSDDESSDDESSDNEIITTNPLKGLSSKQKSTLATIGDDNKFSFKKSSEKIEVKSKTSSLSSISKGKYTDISSSRKVAKKAFTKVNDFKYTLDGYWQEGKYTGEILNNKPEGKGWFLKINGIRYYGDWKGGKMHGQGLFIDVSEELIFKGYFKDNIPYGPGKMYFIETGDLNEGIFSDFRLTAGIYKIYSLEEGYLDNWYDITSAADNIDTEECFNNIKIKPLEAVTYYYQTNNGHLDVINLDKNKEYVENCNLYPGEVDFKGVCEIRNNKKYPVFGMFIYKDSCNIFFSAKENGFNKKGEIYNGVYQETHNNLIYEVNKGKRGKLLVTLLDYSGEIFYPRIDTVNTDIARLCKLEPSFISLQEGNGGGSLDDKIDHLEKFIINEGEYELPEYVLDDIDKME